MCSVFSTIDKQDTVVFIPMFVTSFSCVSFSELKKFKNSNDE